MSAFPQKISEQIWKMKYQFKDFEGNAFDKTVEDTWRRIATSLASVEKSPEEYVEKFYNALSDFKFIPAGRIIAGAGTGRNVTLSNCYTMGTIGDNLPSIMDALKEAALTMQQGGGIGYDFSTLRPKGAHVKGVDADASGPLPFMDMWDAMCRTIMSAGSRRGAMMATMRCDHPDVEEFISVKRDPARLRMFNLSVMITDKFMEAVKTNAQWDLVFDGKVYKTISAKGLWDKIMISTYEYAEPGILFIDRINDMHNLWYVETVATTNPCLHPDTIVETVNGRIRIADMKEPMGVYTMGHDGKLTIRQASPSWVSKTDAKVWRIKTRNGKEIKLTPDHKVFVHDKGWVQAQNLQLGDRIAQLCRARRGSEYSGVKLTTQGNREYVMEHRMIMGHVHGDLGDNVVHHINNNTYDNYADNFEVMSAEDHNRLTASTTHHQSHQVHGDGGKLLATGRSDKRITPMPEELRSNHTSKYSCAIIEIESDFETTDVYDIHVSDTHNFIGNFMVVHNCGEKPMGEYASCLLGSINCAKFVHNPFTDAAFIDWDSLYETIGVAINMMDNVIEVSNFPLEKQKQKAKDDRQLGLGVTGLADMLLMLNTKYGSPESLMIVDELMEYISYCSYRASVQLAQLKGSFPNFNVDKFLASGYMKTADPEIIKSVREYGIRNALITSIAPTGTISLYAGNVSSGIEPIFAGSYTRTVLAKDGSKFDEEVKDYAVHLWKQMYGDKPLPDTFVTAQTLKPEDHIAVQSVVQKYVDSSISKTTNCPEDITLDDFKDVYMMAWDSGCKGCTTYRPNDVTGSILTSKDKPVVKEPESTGGACFISIDPDTGQMVKTCDA